ncbi:hypothetical protein FKM82_011390 [Ascaphus truei]
MDTIYSKIQWGRFISVPAAKLEQKTLYLFKSCKYSTYPTMYLSSKCLHDNVFAVHAVGSTYVFFQPHLCIQGQHPPALYEVTLLWSACSHCEVGSCYIAAFSLEHNLQCVCKQI